jgi:hypothetical protein
MMPLPVTNPPPPPPPPPPIPEPASDEPPEPPPPTSRNSTARVLRSLKTLGLRALETLIGYPPGVMKKYHFRINHFLVLVMEVQ